MPEEALLRVILAIIVGTLMAIVYSLRVLVLMERRIARIEVHIENVVSRLLKKKAVKQKKKRR